MSIERQRTPGRLVAVHTVSPAQMQRSVMVAGAAFVFFLIMMGAYYARQWFAYFLLATAFLIVNLFTLVGIWLQRQNKVTLYENGLVYKKETVLWDDVIRLRLEPKAGLTLTLEQHRQLNIPDAITGLTLIAAHIDSKRSLKDIVRESV